MFVNRTNHSIANGAMLQHAHWGPTFSSILYVLDNDIYYVADMSMPDIVRRITETGKRGVIYNGVPDWVYEGKIKRLMAWFLIFLSSFCRRGFGNRNSVLVFTRRKVANLSAI